MQGGKTKPTKADTQPKSKWDLFTAVGLAIVLTSIGVFIVPWIAIAVGMSTGKEGAVTAIYWVYATFSIALVLWVGKK